MRCSNVSPQARSSSPYYWRACFRRRRRFWRRRRLSSLLLACKIAIHWLTTALPLILVAPLLALLLQLPPPVLPVLLATLALATPLLSLIGAMCVALTIGMRRSGMLLTLLVLPLLVPVLIFGAGACNAAQAGLAYAAPLLWLGAWLALAVVLAPLATAAALRISLT